MSNGENNTLLTNSYTCKYNIWVESAKIAIYTKYTAGNRVLNANEDIFFQMKVFTLLSKPVILTI